MASLTTAVVHGNVSTAVLPHSENGRWCSSLRVPDVLDKPPRLPRRKHRQLNRKAPGHPVHPATVGPMPFHFLDSIRTESARKSRNGRVPGPTFSEGFDARGDPVRVIICLRRTVRLEPSEIVPGTESRRNSACAATRSCGRCSRCAASDWALASTRE